MIRFITEAAFYKKQKSSRICLIGYSGFILCEWFLIAWGWTYTHFMDKSKFKKPGMEAHYNNAHKCILIILNN